jgi:short-subunit dehydrogenase involved in D-alanine esterification of teichoic acids
MSTKQFHAKSTAQEVIEGHNLTGYETIVTGGASGIGIETVRALAKAGARVIIGARDLMRAEPRRNCFATIISSTSTIISRSPTMGFFNQFFRVVEVLTQNSFFHQNFTFYHQKL